MTDGPTFPKSGALAIVAALPRELSGLSRRLAAISVLNREGVQVASTSGRDHDGNVLLVTAGMGAERVALAVAAARAQGPLHTLLSVGLAGACDAHLKAGTALEASTVIDSRTGERFFPDAELHIAEPGVLVTADQVAGTDEKRRLHASYNAAAVDMEAATVARLAQAHGIAFGAVKAISDEHAIDLGHLSRFAGAQGQFRTGAFVFHTMTRPNTWRNTAHLGRSSKVALDTLTRVLHQFIARQIAL